MKDVNDTRTLNIRYEPTPQCGSCLCETTEQELNAHGGLCRVCFHRRTAATYQHEEAQRKRRGKNRD